MSTKDGRSGVKTIIRLTPSESFHAIVNGHSSLFNKWFISSRSFTSANKCHTPFSFTDELSPNKKQTLFLGFSNEFIVDFIFDRGAK